MLGKRHRSRSLSQLDFVPVFDRQAGHAGLKAGEFADQPDQYPVVAGLAKGLTLSFASHYRPLLPWYFLLLPHCIKRQSIHGLSQIVDKELHYRPRSYKNHSVPYPVERPYNVIYPQFRF